MSPPAIRASGLCMRFGDVEALRGVELSITGPGVFGFLGVNGAGKSTTMHLVNGFFQPSAGVVEVFGEPVGPERVSPRRRIGYLQQHPAFYDWMTGLEELMFHGSLVGLSRKEANEQGRALAAELGIADALSRKVGGYSGGMRQRLGLARALLGAPELLLLDEPVSALDPVGRAELLGLVRALGQRATVFMSTHILADIERIADRVTVIHKGAIVVDEPLASLKRRFLRPALELHVRAGDGAAERRPADEEAFVLALEREGWLERLERLSPSEDVEDGLLRLRLALTDADAAARALPALIAAHPLALVKLVPVEPTLEETFLSLVESAS